MKTKCISCEKLRQLSLEDVQALRKDAIGGDVTAQCNLALCYLFAQHLNVDFAEAYHWLEESSLKGNEFAGLFLGYFHEIGWGRNSNFSQAVKLYSKYALPVKSKESNSEVTKAQKMEETEIEKVLSEIHEKACKQLDTILKIKDFCVYNPEANSFDFNWTKTTRLELSDLLGDFNELVERYKIYLDVYTSDTDDDSLGKWTFLYEDTLRLPYEIINALKGRDSLLNDLEKIGYGTLEKEKQFEFALGRCLIDDNDNTDNDYIISGLLIMAGHDEDPEWQNRVALWYEYREENQDLSLAEHWNERAKANNYGMAPINLERLWGKREYRMSKNSNEGNNVERLTIASRIKENKELKNKWLISAAKNDCQQALELLQTSISVNGAQLYTKQCSFEPSWKVYATEQKKCQDRSKKWIQQRVNDFQKSLDDIKRRQEEKERKRQEERRRQEEERRRQEEEWRRQKEEERRRQKEEERRHQKEEEYARLKELWRQRIQIFKQKAKRVLLIVLWTLLGLIVVAGGIFGYFYYNNPEGTLRFLGISSDEELSEKKVEERNIDIHSKEGIKVRLNEIMESEINDWDKPNTLSSNFSRSFVKLYKKVDEYYPKDEESWGQDRWEEINGALKDYKIKKIYNISEDKADVDMILTFSDDQSEWTKKKTFHLVFERSNWFIDDNGYKESMRRYIEEKEKESDYIEENFEEENDYELYLDGSIDKYNIHMDLKIEGKLVSGSYYYLSSGSGSPLKVTGVLDNGHMELNETNDEGMPTGHFDGMYLDGGIYRGVFTNHNGGNMNFEISCP